MTSAILRVTKRIAFSSPVNVMASSAPNGSFMSKAGSRALLYVRARFAEAAPNLKRRSLSFEPYRASARERFPSHGRKDTFDCDIGRSTMAHSPVALEPGALAGALVAGRLEDGGDGV